MIGFRKVCSVAGAILFSLAAQTAIGQTNSVPTQTLSLSDVIQLLGDRNPRIRAEKEAIAGARADRRSAGAFPNPKLGLQHQEPSGQQTLFTGQRQEQISLEVPILIPGQRSSRVAKADLDVAAAQAHYSAESANIMADACASFVHLLSLQQKTEILSNALAEVTRLRDTISGRVTGGASSAYDLERVEVEVGVLASHYESTRVDLAAEASQLASLLAVTNRVPSATGPLQPWEIPETYLADPTSVMSPAAIAAARDAAAAQAGVKVAKRNRWPDVSLSGGRAWTRHPFGAADFVGVNIEIPIFDTKRGQLEKAKSDARAAEDREIAAIAQADATIRQLAQTVERRQAALERYRKEIEPRLTRLKEMSSDAYLMGRHTVLEVLDAEQARREVALENIETMSALVEAQVRLLGITGTLPQFLGLSKVVEK
jgi:cobalt-zinc-cadmium efflux system outer membrane protein